MLSREPSSESYNHLVDGWIDDALSQGHTSFARLVMALPGVYPSVLRDALARLAVRRPGLAYLLRQSDQTLPSDDASYQTLISSSIILPMPHPLDYDWRFTDSAVTYLLDLCQTLAVPGEQVALLGTPSIFHAALAQPLPYRFTLFEHNSVMVASLESATDRMRAVRCDLVRDPLPRLMARVVIADPPWYEDEARAFLWAARRLIIDTGHIIMSVPPLGTRSGMESEWRRTVTWAEQLGLRLLRLESGALPYQTPPFERNALHAEGIPSVPSMWRRGDLAIFAVAAPCAAPRPAIPTVGVRWDEASISGVRIRLRLREERRFRDPTLQQIIGGDVLPSVSRRDPRRAAVDVWTSGNRVFACRGTHIVGAIADAIAVGQPPRDAVSMAVGHPLRNGELYLVNQVTYQLYRIVAREHREAGVGSRRQIDDKSLYRYSS